MDSYVDLVQWLRLRGYADTAGGARQIIKDGRVKSESHVVGKKDIYYAPTYSLSGAVTRRLAGNPRVSSNLRNTLVVTDARA